MQDFASDVFGFFRIASSVQSEIQQKNIDTAKINFSRFFSFELLKAFSAADEAEDYILKGPALNASGTQIKIAAPLLGDIIASIERMMEGDTAKNL